MTLPERSYTGGSGYRFGFNGKETDKEYGAGGGTQDYGFRMYSPAIGKFLSVDPLAPSYPWYTPYQFAGNKPINSIDLDGLEENIVIYQTTLGKPVFSTATWKMRQGETYWSVSQATGIPVSEIKRLNSYADSSIRIGAELKLTEEILPSKQQLQEAIGEKFEYSDQSTKQFEDGSTITTVSLLTQSEKFTDHMKIAPILVTSAAATYLGSVNSRGTGYGLLAKFFNKLDIPQGLSQGQFKNVVSSLEKLKGLSDDIGVHGSRAKGTAHLGSDLDIAVRVDASTFNKVLFDAFETAKPGTARYRTLLNALNSGKITPGNAGAHKKLLREVRKEISEEIGTKVDLSIIRKGSSFDNGPYLKVE